MRCRSLVGRFFIGQVTSDHAAADSANHSMMTGIVPRHAAYRSAFQAAFGAGGAGGACQCKRA